MLPVSVLLVFTCVLHVGIRIYLLYPNVFRLSAPSSRVVFSTISGAFTWELAIASWRVRVLVLRHALSENAETKLIRIFLMK